MEEMDEAIVNEFLVESHENLDQLDRDFVQLEEDPQNREMLARIFRTIHTIKGTSGFLGLGKLEKVTHVGESLLSRLRDGALLLDPEITTVLLRMVDAVRQILSSIESDKNEGGGDYTSLIADLTRLQDPAARAAATAVPVAAAPATAPAVTPDASPAVAPPPSPVSTPAPQPVHAAATETAEARNAGHGVSDSSIRVDVGLLDKLMNLVGELVLARNQVLQFTTAQQSSAFTATSQRLNLITSELQESVMKTRMQPIGNVWSKFPRVVRDLSVMCGKKVRIEMEGQETEIDKTILEAIKDPLTHVVRNSVDHGIESPETRTAAGKPAEGRLFMRAFHEGGQVNIEIVDDGAGIDPEKIRAKALARGLISAEQASRLGDREIVNLVFAPGFSTAEKVTNVSGRGVGMDVVRTNIEKIGGTVDIHSKHGEGTTIRIKIPLTLAIIPALVVTAAGDRYAIPQVSLVELLRLDGEQAKRGIERIHGAPVYRLRGNLLPLVDLARELEIPTETQGEADAINIVVLSAEDRTFGLIVESINDTEEIVVRPLGNQLKGLDCFAGATIMGDGSVALILDVLGIAHRSRVITAARDRSLAEAQVASSETGDAAQAMLLLGVGGEGRIAVPLSLVARLEEFPAAAIEHTGRQAVVQYRGEILPLIDLAEQLSRGVAAPSDPVQVVVYTEDGHSVGLVVDRILDIVEERVQGRRAANRSGLLGSGVIQGRVTDLLDIRGVVQAADPSGVEEHRSAA